MGSEERAYRSHVIVLPLDGQGHLNPMIQFSKRLSSKGVKVTVATILSITKTIQAHDGPVTFEPIFDDCTEGGIAELGGNFEAYMEKFEAICSQNLTKFVKVKQSSRNPVKCIVCDAGFSWALHLAKRLGLAAASFFTQSCTANAIYYHMHKGLLNVPLGETTVSLPGLPPLRDPDLPSFGSVSQRFWPTMKYLIDKFPDNESADWILFNSFDKLEDEVVQWMTKNWRPVRTIGPTLPSMYLDKRLEGNTDYGFNLFKPNGEACMKWLNSKESGSVVYVSFGSLAMLTAEMMEEIAWGLKQSNTNFLWVVRALEQNKLPSNFLEETSGKGLVVSWCSQLEVLNHQTVGCFMTHCGWNSTMEAISLGVPMVAVPQFLDQFTDAKFVEEIWGVGLRAKVDEKEIVRRGEIERCIREVMQGEKGIGIKRNASKWKELAREAMDEGGTSDQNIDDIVAHLVGI